jgi:undecaprenyl phosphate-alpha-L-ara4N flippase subunit ArnF
MSPILLGIIFSLSTALIVIAGDVVIKQAADLGHTALSYYVLAGIALYAVSGFLWFVSVRYVTLASAGVIFSMGTLVALVIIGALAFDEPIKGRDWAGMACAMLAMCLMLREA